jgi:hypothetical protein
MTDDFDEAAFRERQHRMAIEARISSEEWRRQEPFPLNRKWGIPAIFVGAFVLGMLIVAALTLLPQSPRQIHIDVIQAPTQ